MEVTGQRGFTLGEELCRPEEEQPTAKSGSPNRQRRGTFHQVDLDSMGREETEAERSE